MLKGLPFVSVIVPTFNEAKYIERCLLSLSTQDYPRDRYEIVIVDGYSTDSTVRQAGRFCDRILYERKQTRAAACNSAMNTMKGEIAAFTDGDCEVESSWLSNLIRDYDGQSVGGVGGPNTVVPETDLSLTVLFALGTLLGFGRFRYAATYDDRREVYHNPGCNSSVTRKAVFDVGLMNENLLTAEDTELSEKIREAGYKLLYEPSAKLKHYWSFTFRSFFGWMKKYAIGQTQLIRLRPSRLMKNPRSLLLLFPLTAILTAASLFAFTVFHPSFWAVPVTCIGVYCVYAYLCGVEALIRNILQTTYQKSNNPLRFVLDVASIVMIGQLAWGIGTIQGLAIRNK